MIVKQKKTLVQFVREAITNSKKGYAKYSTLTIEDMSGEDEILEDEDEKNDEDNGADDDDEGTGEAIEDYEELVVNFVNQKLPQNLSRILIFVTYDVTGIKY